MAQQSTVGASLSPLLLVLLLLASSACASVSVAPSGTGAGAGAGAAAGAAAFQADDECLEVEGEAGATRCALNAVQLRGQRASAAHHASDSDSDSDSDSKAAAEDAAMAEAQAGACGADPVARMMSTLAPACAKACPQLCEAALPVLAAAQASSKEQVAKAEICARRAHFACALEPANAEACAPALAQLTALALSVPSASEDLDAMCEESPGAGTLQDEAALEQSLLSRASSSLSAGRAALLDKVLAGKAEDPRCEHAPEGQTCVSKNQWIYCSAHKRLSAGTTNCELRSGHLSLCRTDGVGLSRGYCDDPFCRNGGAYAGDGHYCHSSSVVYCKGSAPPRVVDACTDQTYTDASGTTQTRTNFCLGRYPDPYCMF